MTQADSVHSTPPINASKIDDFLNLAAAVSPAWHQAIIRLANVSERVVEKLEWVLEHEQDSDLIVAVLPSEGSSRPRARHHAAIPGRAKAGLDRQCDDARRVKGGGGKRFLSVRGHSGRSRAS